MKKSNRMQWFLGTFLLLLSFFFLYTVNAWANQTVGIIDCADETSVRGWAWDSTNKDQPVDVKVVITNQSNGAIAGEFHTTASKHRDDLTSQGTGNYGFEVSVPFHSYGDGSYLVEAYTNGQKLTGTKVYGIGTVEPAARLIPLGNFKTTAYCPCRKCSGKWGGRTSTGTIAAPEHTISVDPRVIPYGSHIMINGVTYTAEDCGGGVKGNHIDIFFPTHAETRAYGTQTIEVYLVP
ncbi:3D domain-containing protein [Clostridium sp. E02]|uniref:3D domain-containing protein n=1 Tax=Clostridium sp. E02 TaxID=2487134 RepID=UPI000F525FB4|nr:3D domain-containing protein [Clostridium sp. E02]